MDKGRRSRTAREQYRESPARSFDGDFIETAGDGGAGTMPAYVPPKDGKPRDQVDVKWMRLAEASSDRNGHGRGARRP